MKRKSATTTKVQTRKTDAADAIDAYAVVQRKEHAAICRALREQIDASLPKAAAKIWHAMPVWFVEENPVVGYKATPKHVNLLFWNGQSLGEPLLQAAGKFKAAQIKFRDVAEIDAAMLRRVLKKAGTKIWDYAALIRRKTKTDSPAAT